MIVGEGALPPMIALLRSPYERIQEHSVVAVRNLSLNPENEVMIVQEGGLPPLIELLRSSNERLQEHAVVAVRNLSVNEQNEVDIVAEHAAARRQAGTRWCFWSWPLGVTNLRHAFRK